MNKDKVIKLIDDRIKVLEKLKEENYIDWEKIHNKNSIENETTFVERALHQDILIINVQITTLRKLKQEILSMEDEGE